MNYAELHCLSPFSFQRGASSAQELFERAKSLGYTALAITDECSLAGIVRAWEASKESGVDAQRFGEKIGRIQRGEVVEAAQVAFAVREQR